MKVILKQKGDTIFLLILIGIGLYYLVTSFQFNSFKVKLFPVLSSGIIVVLGLAELAMSHLKKVKSEKAEASTISPAGIEDPNDKSEAFYILLAFGWLVGLTLGIILVGFLIAIPLFVFVFLLTYKIKWFPLVITTVATGLVVYYMFDVTMNLKLFPGLLLGGHL